MKACRLIFAAVSVLAIPIGLSGCTPEKSAQPQKETTGKAPAKAKAPPPASPAPSAEAPTDPCGENDDACYDLPRDRAEFGSDRFPEDEPDVRLNRDDEALAFYYGYPKRIETEKPLAAFLHRDSDQLYAESLETGRKDRAKAVQLRIGPAYKKIVIERRWAVTGWAQRLVGLVKADGNVTIHEQTIEEPVVWDRKLGKTIPFSQLFLDPKAGLRRVERDYCALLKKQVIEFDPSSLHDEGTLNADYCPPLSELPPPALVGGKDGQIEDFLVLAGHFRHYADGPFEVSVPITDALIALIKPEYRGDFKTTLRTSSVTLNGLSARRSD